MTPTLTLDNFAGTAYRTVPAGDLLDRTHYVPVTTMATARQACDYCLQNLKTHPKEKLWFFLRPARGDFQIVREVVN